MTAITAPGIYLDFPTADYFADPCPQPSLTQSVAKLLIERSPAHAAAAHPRLGVPVEEDEAPEKYVVAQAIGNAAHALLIGRGKDIAVGDFADWRKGDAKEFKAAAIAEGREPILWKHMDQANAMVSAARRQLDAAGWKTAFTEGNGEVVIAWQEGDLWFRSLIDWMVNPRLLIDLKTSAMSCAPHAIPKMMANAGWDVQAAFHERGLDVLEPDNAGRRTFRFVALENEPPFALTPVELTEAVMTMGRKKVAYAVDAWRRSIEAGTWPAYPSAICRPEYPGYAESQWLAREVAESEQRDPRKLHSLMGG